MKKRIISLILVVALSVLVLAGCGYSYQKDDLYQYAGTDKATLSAALAAKFKGLTIDDGEFGHVESERQEYLVNEIYERIATAFASDKKTVGIPDGKDNVYYCYYATVVNTDKDGNVIGEHTIYANKMAYNATASTTGATSIALGNEDAAGLEKLIAAALAGIDIEDYAYTTDTSATLAAGDKVYISYTKSVPKIDDNNEVISDQYDKITVSYGTLEIPAAAEKDETSEGDASAQADDAAKKSFAEQLIGKKAGSSKLTGTFEAYETVKGLPNQKVTYSDVTVHFVVESGAPISFEYTYDKDTLGSDYKKTTSEKDIYGESIKLDGKKITYNVFPVYYIDVNLDAASIIKGMFKDTTNNVSTFEADTFECIKELCDSNPTINTLVTGSSGLVALLDKYCAKDSKAADSAAVDSQIEFILEKAAEAGVTDLEEQIIAEYKEMVYDELDKAYDSEIQADLLIAIYNAINETIKLDLRDEDGWYKLPKDAVEDAYDMYMDMYEYNFYEGLAEGGSTTTDTSDDVTNYDKYEGNFNNYLIAVLGLDANAEEQAIYDKIGAQAEEDVRQRIRVHLVADCLGITVTDEEIDEFKYNNAGFQSLIASGREPSEEDIITAMLANKMFDHLLAIDESKTGDENNLQPVFFNITYTFKVDEEEEESKDETEDTTEGDTEEESDK